MADLNELRRELALVPDVTPVTVRITVATSDKLLTVAAGDLLRNLGPDEFTGQWCYPVGVPGEKIYPPKSERYPDLVWSRENWLVHPYVLDGTTSHAIHTGDDLDLAGYKDIGEPVRAPCMGVVTYARLVPGSTWGNVLILRCYLPDAPEMWFYIRFAHLNGIKVSLGDIVVPGQIVGWVGNVGMPTSPHLHYDITRVGDDLLFNQPLNWPSSTMDDVTAKAYILDHYVDPGAFLRNKIDPPPPLPEPSGTWYITTAETLNVRREPKIVDGNVITALSRGTLVRLADEIFVSSGNSWRQVTECSIAAAVGGYLSTSYVTLPPVQGDWLAVKADTVVNVRNAPAGTVIGTLMGGDVVRVLGNISAVLNGTAWTWGQITDVESSLNERLKDGWVARELLVNPNQPPPEDWSGGGLGFNFIGPGSPNELIQFIQMRRSTLTVAGNRRRVYVIINETKAVFQVAETDPQALIVYRVKTGTGREEPDPWDYMGRRWSAREWFDLWKDALLPGIRTDGGRYAITWKNEVFKRERIQFCIEFDIAMMRLCTSLGIRCTYLNSAVDNVKVEDVDALKVLFEVARSGPGGGHILSANTYWYDEAPERFTYIVPLVKDAHMPWMHGEVGWAANDASYQAGRELELANRHDQAFLGIPYYEGGAIWGINPMGDSAGSWPHSHFKNWPLIARR